jgi:hypothetical protein
MPKDPTIATRDCLAEIASLHEIERRMTLQLREVITTDTHALKTVMESMLARHAGEGSS